MDVRCINSIIKCILQSDMSEVNINHIQLRPVVCEIDEDGKEIYNVKCVFGERIFEEKVSLSEAWVAGNLLLFAAFNGYLENMYNLKEGVSFRNHYDNLPENSLLERISKNCYRIIKIIRNGIQHNLSEVNYIDGNYDINYHYKKSLYELQIAARGIRNLYTLIVNIIQGKISGMDEKYNTIGHYEGILYTQYIDMLKEVKKLSDDSGSDLLNVSRGIKLRAGGRYPVENPRIIMENETSITFKHIENNITDDENTPQYCYSTDYIYKEFLIPQEIGKITRGKSTLLQERINQTTICFQKKDLDDKWKMQPGLE